MQMTPVRNTAVSLLAAAAIFALALATAGGASASTITQEVQFSTSKTVAGAVNQMLALLDTDLATANKFDPGLGTLDAVRIALSGTVTTTATAGITASPPICPPAPAPTPCPVTAELRFVALGMEFALPDFIADIPIGDRSAPCNGVFLCFAELAALDADFAQATTLTGSALDGYIGPGTFALPAVMSGVLSFINFFPPGAVGDFNGEMTAMGSIRIVYDYTPATEVPEPAALAMLGIGLAGLAASRLAKSR